jgi:spermidine synthase
VVVAELVAAVVEWNRGPLAHLAGRPLDDARASVHVGDVGALLRATTVRWDAVLLDVDNGPSALTRKGNQLLYSPAGLELIKRTLRRGGTLAVWSADRSPEFEKRLRKAGFDASSVDVPARGVAGGPAHTIFVARVAS